MSYDKSCGKGVSILDEPRSISKFPGEGRSPAGCTVMVMDDG